MDAYRTVAQSTTARIVRKRSRFIAVLEPTADLDDVASRLAETRRRYHDATHWCYAYRLAEEPEPTAHSDDAGEPAGSAGLPILLQLEKAELLGVLAVVVRYFGGVKLGVGGLSRAYADAVAEVVAAARIVLRRITVNVRIRFPLEVNPAVMTAIHRHEAAIVDIRYDTEGQIVVAVPPSRVAAFEGSVIEGTGARARLEVAR